MPTTPDTRHDRLARLDRLERRYDGPIPEPKLRALGFASAPDAELAAARRAVAFFRERIVRRRDAAKHRRTTGEDGQIAANVRATMGVYLASWRAGRRRMANLLPEPCESLGFSREEAPMRPVLPDTTPKTSAARCPRCGSTAGLHYVHGHAQCATCGANVEDCCQGAACDLAAKPPTPER